jgi:hypothetical protein
VLTANKSKNVEEKPMGDDRAVNFYDNNKALASQEAIDLIKNYFLAKLPSFIYVREYDDPHGYWGVIFTNEKCTVLIGSERGFIDYCIEINELKVVLADFDSRVAFLKQTSKKNLLFLIDTIGRYLSPSRS